MTDKNINALSILKKANIFDVLFFATFITCIVFSILKERAELIYISPIVVVTILLKYISLTKKNANVLFIITLLSQIIANYLSFYSFQDYFTVISSLTGFYLLLYCIILRKYLHKIDLKKLITLSVIIGCLLVGYVIYSVVSLIISYIPNHNIIYVLICATCLFIYVIIFARIFLNNNYENTGLIFASGIASLFSISLSPINEYFFYSKTFTVLILICHYLSIYLFMKFISETNAEDKKIIDKKYF
ncbi:hypothetical protein CLV86_0706 [Lacinutrix venerupis]|uniref:Uncharacterized protein n=1 Tax=Lacinutrix venerupis TaxID=1486034 RepID=A0AAC9LM61_9FLAO|nr:hypothetical protein [Lacinutrix venerupis]APY01050.1 hypothetical protein BWR22_12270 [Lacinutrix venerupis]RLJ67214.1 hypothetical protein CLV86_0706 [Lacinutrix venerupis]